ncbi:MAG: choice-of-anchor R domain-containing protein [Candidatus Sulfomarinibacteraceae bacterium]
MGTPNPAPRPRGGPNERPSSCRHRPQRSCSRSALSVPPAPGGPVCCCHRLAANTTYWFVLDGPATTNSLLWQTLSPNVAPTAGPGATYVGYRFSSNGGSTWGSSSLFNGVEINADVVPVELQSFTIE